MLCCRRLVQHSLFIAHRFRSQSGLQACVFGAALASGLAAGPLPGVEDRAIKYKNNEAVVGEIKKAELTNVDIQVRDPRTQTVATVSLSAAEIADIEWDVPSLEWRTAWGDFESAQYAKAAQGFLGILDEPQSLEHTRSAAKPAWYDLAAISAPESVSFRTVVWSKV